GRAPTQDRLRRHAHRGFGVANPDRAECADLADRLWRRLSDHLPLWGRADGADRAPRAARRRPRTRPGRRRPTGSAGQGATRSRAAGAAMSVPMLDFVPIWTIIL